ncbi:MAG: ATP-grasp domain-containing protein [Phycisphaeraceae bacterium]|nr:ATP-grasp domain-containing protein [Phycisphaeraceae bacterium]
MNNRRHDVLIVASTDWISAARLVPVLKRAGCVVTVVGPRDSALLKTGGVDQAVVGGETIQQTIDTALKLIDHAPRPFDYIQIADDPLLWHLADHRHQDRLKPITPFDPASEVGDILTSKHSFTEKLSGPAFKVVPGHRAFSNAEALDAADRLGYPVILKPSRGSGGVAVAMHHSEAQLKAYLRKNPIDRPCVVQRFIRGRVGLVEALLDHGKPKCWTVWYKTQTIRGPFGGSSARELFTLPEMEEQLFAFGQATGWHGFCGLDLIHEEDTGDFYFIEVNARQTTGNLFGWCAQADFSEAFAAMLDGRAEQFPPVQHRLDGLRIRSFPADIDRAIYDSDAWSLLTAPFDPALWRDIRSQDVRLIKHGGYVVWLSAKRKIKHIFGKITRTHGQMEEHDSTYETAAR